MRPKLELGFPYHFKFYYFKMLPLNFSLVMRPKLELGFPYHLNFIILKAASIMFSYP